MKSNVKVVAQLNKSENSTHMKRAGVEDIIIDSDLSGFLMSNAPFSPGIPMLAREILTYEGDNFVKTELFPSELKGKDFKNACMYYLNANKILVGILTTVKEVSLTDIASGQMGLDLYIREKFGDLENEYFGEGDTITININPGNEYIIQDEDSAFIISRL